VLHNPEQGGVPSRVMGTVPWFAPVGHKPFLPPEQQVWRDFCGPEIQRFELAGIQIRNRSRLNRGLALQ